jgi:tellurite methyltransferase
MERLEQHIDQLPQISQNRKSSRIDSLSIKRKTQMSKSSRKSQPGAEPPEPCAMVRRFGARLVEAANGAPIVDVGCGAGRNAIHLARLGGTVICIDRNSELLRRLPRAKRLVPLHMDLDTERWPFAQGQLGGIVSVHFLKSALFPQFESSLSPGGCMLVETVSAHGGNFVELPREGELRHAFEEAFQFEFLKEKKAGPVGCGKVTVRLLAKRLMPS